jgi:hypothetical protein
VRYCHQNHVYVTKNSCWKLEPGVAEVHAIWVTVISIMFILQQTCWNLEPTFAELYAMWVTVISIMFMLQQTDAGS